MYPASSARRPKGYVRRSTILGETRLIEQEPARRKMELKAKFEHVNAQIKKWRKVFDRKNLTFVEFVRAHYATDPNFRKEAADLARRMLIAEKRIAPLYRKSLALTIHETIENAELLPEGQKALWDRMNSQFKKLEKEEAMVHRLLKDKVFFQDWVDGCIARIIER